MAGRKSFIEARTNPVNWEDPYLDALIAKTEHWKLDNREAYLRRPVTIQQAWGTDVNAPGTLVWESDSVIAIETDFEIPTREQIRVDAQIDDGIRRIWGAVIRGRKGTRPGDDEQGVHIHWLLVSSSSVVPL